MTTPLVKRTTLIVRDLARSVAFYRDVIGLSVWYDDTIELSGVGLAAGKKGDQTHLVIMKSQDPIVGMIGLLEFTTPRLPEPPRRVRRRVDARAASVSGSAMSCSSCRVTTSRACIGVRSSSARASTRRRTPSRYGAPTAGKSR